MKQENVQYAVKNLPSTNISKKKSVTTACVKEVLFISNSDVYNMEVDTYHNFAISGGLIVHNCSDAARYMCHTILRHELEGYV